MKDNTFSHAEAFCLMRYQSDDGKIVEHLWNSRDGVTPFTILAKDKRTQLTHTMRHMERMPHHIPMPGDRVFVDMTRDKALEYAMTQAHRYSEHFQERYPTESERADAIRAIADSNYGDGHAPDIITVEERLDGIEITVSLAEPEPGKVEVRTRGRGVGSPRLFEDAEGLRGVIQGYFEKITLREGNGIFSSKDGERHGEPAE